jgi:phage gp29-like protein
MSKTKSLTSELLTIDLMAGYSAFSGILPNPDKVLRRTGKTIEAYRELKNDPHVWSCIQSRKSGTLSLESTLLPNNCSRQILSEIQSMLNELDLHKITRDILEAPLYGFQPIEILWQISTGNHRFIAPTDLIAKPQEWFFFNKTGDLRYRISGLADGAEPPPMKIINIRYESSYINPYGQALLSKCYWPVLFKTTGMKEWVRFTEKFGMPLLIGQYQRGASADEIERMLDHLINMVDDTVIVTPTDFNISMKESVRSSSVTTYRELIRQCNTEISKAILSQTLTTELDSGSYAASMTHFKVRREVIMSDIRLVESAFNQLLRHIIDLNFAGSAYPQFKIVMNEGDNLQKVDRDIKITQSGALKFTKQYWMENYGFRPDEIMD